MFRENALQGLYHSQRKVILNNIILFNLLIFNLSPKKASASTQRKLTDALIKNSKNQNYSSGCSVHRHSHLKKKTS
jgi:hypothetical protein